MDPSSHGYGLNLSLSLSFEAPPPPRMDSCSSPSHAFKDRPHSRLDDLSRQPSRPRCFDSAKSPAPTSLPDLKEKPDLSRNLIRRSYGSCSSEMEAGDDLLESSDRGRSSLRRSFGFERSERHHDFETERYRSARSGGDGGGGSRTPSRNLDRESLERPFSRRSSHGGDPHRHEVFEGVSSSPLRNERSYGACKPAPRKGSGFDKERRDGGDFSRGSSSPERDGDACKSPSSGNGFGFTRREFSNFSPRRYGVSDRDGAIRASPRKDFGLEKDCTRLPRSSPMERDGTGKHRLSSPRKAFGREREVRVLDDIDVTSPKLKFRFIKDEEKHKEHGASSGETSSRSWNKSFSSRSRGGGEDAIEEEHWSEADGSHKDVWSERSPMMTSIHISKRVRSDRDRGRREELASKATQRHVYGNELEQAHRHKAHAVEKLDFDVAVKKEVAVNEGDVEGESMDEANDDAESSPRNVDVVVVQSDERPYGKLQTRYSVSNRGDKSDMEEGELEPEGYVMEKHNELDTTNYAELKAVDIEEGEKDDIQNCAAVPIHAKKDEEAQEGILKVVTEVKSQLNGNWDKSHEGQDEINKRCDREDSKKPLLDRKEEQVVVTAGKNMVDLQLQCRSMAPSTTKFMEIGESSKGGLTLDLLDARTKSWNLNPTDKGHYLSRELTLSLFTKPVEVKGQGESSESKGHTLGSQSKSNEQNGNQIERVNDSEERMTGQHMGGAGEESSQHSGHKQKKLKLESLQLSLALPGTSATVAGSNPSCLAGPREPERSFQSLTHTQTQTQNFSQSQTHTNSDGFTTSFPFSQSQSFIHNPSCSLNCTSLENQELSCGGSRQISQGTEQMSHRSWPALSGNEQTSNGMHTVTSLSQDKSKYRRGIPLYQQILQNGNMHQGFPSVTGSNRSTGSNHVSQRSHQFGQRFQAAPKILDSSSQDLEGSGRQATAHKDLMEKVRQQKAWLASKQRAMSGETHSEPNALQGRERLVDLPACNAKRQSSVANDAVIGERNILSEKIGLHEISTEPVAVMAQKLQELPDSFLEGLRGLAKEMLGSFEKREEFITLQENIQRRMDLTEDTLLRAHRTQLEILVALRTGMQAFVQEGSKPQTYKALIDIFLQTRCRNIACQQSLPVCGCECRICSKKSGFCHQCMCVVCFKFDTDDNNTCRWVVCDLCLHRCHTDCALRMSYIAPTPGIQDATGTTEMQYHCVACDHNSELFGFVKEVFHKFAEVWGAETLAKELDCVLRLFHGSEDMRGKQLCWKAKQMLQKLENKVDAAEVCRSMLRFFNEGNAELDGVCTGPKKKPSSFKSNDVSNHMADAARETMPKASSSGGNKLVDLDKAHVVPQNLEEKRTEAAKLQYDRARKRAEIEDIESISRIKQAEAKMFQVRADEARQEASGLQRIISVKREKIDEDYDCKYAKLRLSEAEERHRKRFEELQAFESAQHDYQKMKSRMEAEIKELLMKMEIAKQQFT